MRNLKSLIKNLKDENWHVRQTAVKELVKIDNSSWAVKVLISHLKNGDLDVTRRIIVQILGKIGDSQAVGSLIDCLKDEDLYVRRYAVEALGKISDPRAIEPLIVVLNKDPDIQARRKVGKALRNIRFRQNSVKWQRWREKNIAK